MSVNLRDVAKAMQGGNSIDDRVTLARTRTAFLQEDTEFIRKCLINDLKKFVDNADISRMKLITLDFFVPAFIDKICDVYDNAPILKFPNDEQNQDLINLLNDSRFFLVLQDNFSRLKMHGTTLPYIRYNKDLDKIWIDLSLDEGTCEVFTHSGDRKYPVIVAYAEKKAKDETWYYVWDRLRREHYYLKEPVKYNEATMEIVNEKKYFIGDNKDLKSPPYWPIIDYHYKITSGGFWGAGMDSLVELERVINLLLTVSADDTVQETIRLLILNFDPVGETGEQGQIKTGMRHPLFKESGFASEKDPYAQIVSADLYNSEVVDLIEKLTDIISNIHSIDNIIKASVTTNLSGIAIKLKSEPLLQRWAKDINIVRYFDHQLLRALVQVHNYHRSSKPGYKKIPEALLNGISLDYQKPNMVADEKEDYNLERLKWEDGTSSPVIYMMQRNPELSEKEAIKHIKKNLADTENFAEALQISVTPNSEQENVDLGNK